MDGYFVQALKSPGGEPRVIWGSFAPNAGSTPVAASNGGPIKNFTVAYAATGAFTVTLPDGYVPIGSTPEIIAFPQCESLTEHFVVCKTGAWNPTTRSFVLQAHRNGTGREVAAHAAARITFFLIFNNSTGA